MYTYLHTIFFCQRTDTLHFVLIFPTIAHRMKIATHQNYLYNRNIQQIRLSYGQNLWISASFEIKSVQLPKHSELTLFHLLDLFNDWNKPEPVLIKNNSKVNKTQYRGHRRKSVWWVKSIVIVCFDSFCQRNSSSNEPISKLRWKSSNVITVKEQFQIKQIYRFKTNNNRATRAYFEFETLGWDVDRKWDWF